MSRGRQGESHRIEGAEATLGVGLLTGYTIVSVRKQLKEVQAERLACDMTTVESLSGGRRFSLAEESIERRERHSDLTCARAARRMSAATSLCTCTCVYVCMNKCCDKPDDSMTIP